MRNDRASEAWEQDKPCVAIAIRWGASALHVGHLAPPRSFFVGEALVGEAPADAFLPAEALGAARAQLFLVDDKGGVRLVLLPSMKADGVIRRPGQPALTVGSARTRARAESTVSGSGSGSGLDGALTIALPLGSSAALAIGDFSIEISVERAGRAVAGHYHVSKRMVPFQLAATIVHLAALGAIAIATPRAPHAVLPGGSLAGAFHAGRPNPFLAPDDAHPGARLTSR